MLGEEIVLKNVRVIHAGLGRVGSINDPILIRGFGQKAAFWLSIWRESCKRTPHIFFLSNILRCIAAVQT
jgi:hypothetical protein